VWDGWGWWEGDGIDGWLNLDVKGGKVLWGSCGPVEGGRAVERCCSGEDGIEGGGGR